MPWSPESDPMITVSEMQEFSLTVQYYDIYYTDVDPETGSGGDEYRVYHNVTITPVLTDPPTIRITNNGTTEATISGHYGPVFQEEMTIMNTFDVSSENNTAKPTYQTFDTLNSEPKGLGVWQKYPYYDTFEVIKFDPNMTRIRDIQYKCTVNGSTTIRTVRVQDLDWTPGMIALKNAVDSKKRRK